MSLTRRVVVVLSIAWITTAIGGCHSKPEGKYVGAGGMAAIEFKGDKAILTSPTGGSETDDYTVDGDKITIKSKAGDLSFTLMKDGSLEGAFGTFKKSAG